MSQKLQVNGFEWIGDISEINEEFMESCNDEGDEGSFLEVHIQYPEKLMTFTMIYYFGLKE